MYRLLGDNHTLEGLPFSAQVFLRALDGVRSRLASNAGVSGLELRALSRVAEQTGLTSSTLAAFMELSTTVTGSLIDALSSKSLISVTVDSNSPATSLTLTPLGHQLVATMYEDFQESVNAAASTLDDERRWGLDSGMLKMARKLDERNASIPLTAHHDVVDG